MHILIKNKKLSIADYKVKCAVGKRGIKIKKKEGDLITPKGTFRIKCVFYRKDRVSNLKSKIKKTPIKKNMGWCDDPRSKKYNMLVKLPFNYKTEKLYKSNNTYDVVLVLNYNMNPIKKNKGSAIFIHIAKKNYVATAGCIAIQKKDMKKIIKKIVKKTLVKIN
tara:strand:+ start:242 stop:733 length:492 start_codon:yes stop_codon:yes gene_type:complete